MPSLSCSKAVNQASGLFAGVETRMLRLIATIITTIISMASAKPHSLEDNAPIDPLRPVLGTKAQHHRCA